MFNEKTYNIDSKLKNKDKIKTTNLLDINSLKTTFIDTEFSQKVCDKLNMLFQKLIKV